MIGLYKEYQKYVNIQSEAKLEQIIAIVTTHSVFLLQLVSLRKHYKIYKKTNKWKVKSINYEVKKNVEKLSIDDTAEKM